MPEVPISQPKTAYSGTGWIAKSPIFSFLLLTFVFSYLLGGAFHVWASSYVATSGELATLYLPRLFIVTGPAFAALIVTYHTKGNSGLGRLLLQLIPKKEHLAWYLFLVVACFALTIGSFIIAGLSPSKLVMLITNHWPMLLAHLAIQLFIIGLGEEIGWRGWLLPALTKRFTFLSSILILTLIWAVWHFPIFFAGAEIVFPWLMTVTGASFLLAYSWLRTNGNIFGLALGHASINTLQFFLENQGKLSEELLLRSWKYSGFLYLVQGALCLFLMRKQLFKKLGTKREE